VAVANDRKDRASTVGERIDSGTIDRSVADFTGLLACVIPEGEREESNVKCMHCPVMGLLDEPAMAVFEPNPHRPDGVRVRFDH
jgi:hypothetical protein